MDNLREKLLHYTDDLSEDVDLRQEAIATIEQAAQYMTEDALLHHSRVLALAYLALTDAADVAPVVHGHWKASGALLECQNCGEIYSRLGGNAGKSWNYCPNCGAKMAENMPKDGAD